jgi:hypothetical protein
MLLAPFLPDSALGGTTKKRERKSLLIRAANAIKDQPISVVDLAGMRWHPARSAVPASGIHS